MYFNLISAIMRVYEVPINTVRWIPDSFCLNNSIISEDDFTSEFWVHCRWLLITADIEITSI